VSAKASIGGMAWFGADNIVYLNKDSGRFGRGHVSDSQWSSSKKEWGSLGYTAIDVSKKKIFEQ
jgi:hypothetical protein